MTVREFEDASGRPWRAWDINPDSIHPQTKAEDYLADCFQYGWIVFETFDGSDKRRLCPPPKGWDSLSDVDLGTLLERAERIPLSKLARQRMTAGETPASVPRWDRKPDDRAALPPDKAVDVTDLRVMRSFHYPRGRIWAVNLVPDPDAGPTPVLRFSSGARHFDLRRWPRDWPDYPDERLAELLRKAAPRTAAGVPPAGIEGRRFEDSRG